MAGTIIADRVQLDTFTDTFKIVSNTGVEVVTANSLGILTGVADGTITSAKLANNLTVNASSIISSSNVDFKVGASQNTAFRIEDTGQLYNSIESTQGTDYRGTLYAGYMARAWVNFDGTTNTGGNCDIRASGNVSTVADNGTGSYTINFTTAMPDTNYSLAVCPYVVSNQFRGLCENGDIAKSTSAVSVVNLSHSSSVSGVRSGVQDSAIVSVSIFR